MELISIRDLYRNKEEYLGKKVTVGGWVRSVRDSKTFGFIVLNDGTPGSVFGASQQTITAFKEAHKMAVQEKIRVKLRSYEHTLADQAAAKIVDIAKRNGAEVSGPIPLPTEKEIITILRAVHKYKDSREQFEQRTHKRLIEIHKPSQKVVEALMSVELPAGVDIDVKL